MVHKVQESINLPYVHPVWSSWVFFDFPVWSFCIGHGGVFFLSSMPISMIFGRWESSSSLCSDIIFVLHLVCRGTF